MAYIANSQRPSTSAPGDGSRTITITDAAPREYDDSDASSNPGAGTLKLRGGHKTRQRVAWGEDVIDNEGCGKKKSKICCIYHKPKRFDESSDESSSSDSDAEYDPRRHRRPHAHSHAGRPHGHGDGGTRMRPPQVPGSGVVHELESDVEPNAYETAPSKKGKRRAV